MSASIGRLDEPSRLRRLVVDDVTFTYVIDGEMRMLPERFFPDIPAEHWRSHPEQLDDAGRVVMSAGGLLVQREGRALLIDAGFGRFDGDLDVGTVRCGSMLDSLAAAGVAPSSIEVVALTHLHIDHVGWLFTGPDGDRVPVFPNADYVVAVTELDFAEHADVGLGSPDRAGVITPLTSTALTVDPPAEVFPGVQAVAVPGHTPGHVAYVVTTAPGRRVIAFGDVAHIPAQLAHPEWCSAPDQSRADVGRSRSWLLHELARSDTIGFGIHFGDQAFGVPDRAGAGLAWRPLPTELVRAG